MYLNFFKGAGSGRGPAGPCAHANEVMDIHLQVVDRLWETKEVAKHPLGKRGRHFYSHTCWGPGIRSVVPESATLSIPKNVTMIYAQI